jgi:hypothetical protein
MEITSQRRQKGRYSVTVKAEGGPMQTRSDEFRIHAEECQQIANRFPDSELRRQYEVLARQWRELAEQIQYRSVIRRER